MEGATTKAFVSTFAGFYVSKCHIHITTTKQDKDKKKTLFGLKLEY